MKAMLFLTFVFLFVGCAGSIYRVQSSNKQFINYEVDRTQEVSIGESIISAENAEVVDAYEAILPYQMPSIGLFGNKNSFINKGDRFSVVGYAGANRDGILLQRENSNNNSVYLSIYPNGKVNHGFTLPNGQVPVQGSWTEAQLFKLSDDPTRVRSFRSEIIYSGINGKLLKAVYREYSNDMARSAFSQELQYDLNESDIISYKSIKIKVIKATNSRLEYVIIEDGNLNWLPR